MVGQVHVLKALTNALEQDRLHHAYLFTGTRGVGKTTLARILAKCLNCEQGVVAIPCDKCVACTGINESRFVDLIEVDAASRAKVEETRDLMDNVQYAPSCGRYKVYLIDEIHMFSGHSFNALLKTLEEPPPHVKFLLATTEPRKLPVTILSRCLQFNLRHLTVGQIGEQLVKILQSEAVAHDQSSVELIARSAQGSMRDALSLLDHAISHGGGALEEGQVRNMLGAVDVGDLTELINGLLNRDGPSMIAAVDRMAAYDPDYDSALAELLSLLQKAAMAQVLSGAAEEIFSDNELVRSLAEKLDKEEIQLYYQIGLTGRHDLSISPDPKSGFEMILIRMLAFKPVQENMLHPGNNEEDRKKVATEPPPKSLDGEEKQQASGDSVPEWRNMIDAMGLKGLVKEFAGNCVLKSHTADRIELAISTALEYLLDDTQKGRLEKAVKDHFGAHMTVAIDMEEIGSESPAQAEARELGEKNQGAVKSLEQDRNVKAIIDAFDGSLDRDSVGTD